MTRLNEIPKGKSITGCIFGAPGTGKSHMMGTAGDRTLYCNIENRLGTFQDPSFPHKFNPIVITVFEEPNPNMAMALVKLTDEINKAIREHEGEFDHIIVDGASALNRYAMNMALELNLKTGKSKSNDKVSSVTKDFPYKDVQIQDFGTMMNLVEKFIITMKEYCLATNKHFWMTAHERIEYNKPAKIGDDKAIRYCKPGFIGQTFPDSIPGLFELVWHSKVIRSGGKANYIVETEGRTDLTAKSCIGNPWPAKYVNPNIQDIVRKIQNG